MDTEEDYLDCDFYVRMAGEMPPDFVVESYEPDEFNPAPLRDHHPLNEDVPIDGQVCFYWPDRLGDPEAKGWRAFDLLFRDHRKDDAPWSARPEETKWSKHPVWKWKNPGADREHITLEPSLVIRSPESDRITFHCYIRQGSIDWL